MEMVKETYHPNAYLTDIRNIKQGLKTRTLILNALEKCFGDARTIGNEVQLHYGVVTHHLRLLRTAGIVEQKTSRKPTVWGLTGVGQKRLMNSS